MSKNYIISESRLRELLKKEIELNILESNGIENWGYYMDGAEDYLINMFDVGNIDDAVTSLIQLYTKVGGRKHAKV